MTPELQAAIQRRAGGSNVPATAQVSQSAPTANPAIQAPQPATAAVPGVPQASANASQTAGNPQLPFDSSEAKIILQAMGGRLKALSKMQGA